MCGVELSAPKDLPPYKNEFLQRWETAFTDYLTEDGVAYFAWAYFGEQGDACGGLLGCKILGPRVLRPNIWCFVAGFKLRHPKEVTSRIFVGKASNTVLRARTISHLRCALHRQPRITVVKSPSHKEAIQDGQQIAGLDRGRSQGSPCANRSAVHSGQVRTCLAVPFDPQILRPLRPRQISTQLPARALHQVCRPPPGRHRNCGVGGRMSHHQP